MAINSDSAFKFGCGRYIQEENAIEKNLYNELKRLGKKVLFIIGKNGYAVAMETIKKHSPTSAATCVPTSALSIMYDRETRVFQGSYICKKEADAVIVDTQIMIKYAIPNKEITQEFETALFNMIAVTGIISGLSKNSSQTAIGHAVYYAVRTKFCNEARAFLHGEIVGIGLIAQLAFNDGDFISMRDLLKKMNLPTSLSDIKILPSEENKHFFVDKLCENKDIVSPQEKHKVDFAISKIL